MTEDEIVRWHLRLNGHEFEKSHGDSEGQGSLAWCNPWDHKDSNTTQQLDKKNKKNLLYSTWNFAQYYVVPWMVEEFGEEWTHVCGCLW